MIYSKERQTQKLKSKPKKLSKTQNRAYWEWIYDKAVGMCQSECGKMIAEYHHSLFGIHKDDHYQGGICHECHYAIHHGRDIEKKKKLIELFETIGEQNKKDYFDTSDLHHGEK